MTASEISRTLENLGRHLGFDVASEVEARDAYWVDVVWFDSRLPLDIFGRSPKKKRKVEPLPKSLLFPVVGFEIHTSFPRKALKGSVKNLEVLGAPVGCLVIAKHNRNYWKGDLDACYRIARDSNIRVVVLTDEELSRIHQLALQHIPIEKDRRGHAW